MLITISIFPFLAQVHGLLGIISLLGGGMLLYLGVSNFRVREIDLDVRGGDGRAFTKGFAVAILNPHAYLFWFTIGAPLGHRALEEDWTSLVSFLLGFFLSLVGTKTLLAGIVGRTRLFMRGDIYRYIMWALGAGLCFLSVLFFREGIGYFR